MLLKNLKSIIKESDRFLLDRGDLSAEINIVNLPKAQRNIISEIKKRGSNKRLILATQFLSNMVRNRLPLIAEVNDIENVLQSGVDGIQLSEEISIGKFPIDCVKLVASMAASIPSKKSRRGGMLASA